MATRESYARVTSAYQGTDCTIGLETRDGDDLHTLLGALEVLAENSLRACGGHEGVVAYIEVALFNNYAGRAYFVETEEDGCGLQVYQPWGMPRE